MKSAEPNDSRKSNNTLGIYIRIQDYMKVSSSMRDSLPLRLDVGPVNITSLLRRCESRWIWRTSFFQEWQIARLYRKYKNITLLGLMDCKA